MEKEQALLRLLERIPIPVVIASPVTAKVLWVNQRLAEMYGVEDPHAVIGRSLFDFIDPSQSGRALADLARVVAGQSPPPVTYQLKRVNGEHAAGQISSVPLVFQRQPAMLSFVADVSEREGLVRSLSESEERYRRLLEMMPSGVAVIDDHENVAYVNPALVRVSGFDSAEDLIGKPIYQFIAAEQRASVREFRYRLLQQGGDDFPAVPLTLVRPDGIRLETSALNTVIRWEGQIAIQSLLYDVGLRPEVIGSE